MSDELIAKKIGEAQLPTFTAPERFEIMVPLVSTGMYDEKGNPISGSRKEIVSAEQLNRQKENLLAEIAQINAKLEAINNITKETI